MLKPSVLSRGGSFTQGYWSHTLSNLMNFMNAPQSAGVFALIRPHKQQRVTTVNWVAAVCFPMLHSTEQLHKLSLMSLSVFITFIMQSECLLRFHTVTVTGTKLFLFCHIFKTL